ncbi:TetR/AcrR family transcriptional regulator [Marinobacter mobilis]|uniref:Transcriptional regulator, TetR family n=1 Tax=Marinobacter mobilis TaxID=488533 RepID=A0A1H2R3H5_9GAMM|nr:TetR/AcrR family transcriptional regulator [Marinobacter mobilis]SDW13937.1 transcriptional regulator, TetR family [Marinobacter mobilis]
MNQNTHDVGSEADTAALRKQLVNSARDVVRREGMAALNFEQLASLTGTPQTTLQTLFNDKPGLIRALYESWVEEWQQRLMSAIPTTPVDALMRRAAHIYRELACSDRALLLASTTPVAIEADLFGVLGRSAAFELFANFVKTGMAERRLRVSADPEATVRTLWAGIHGAVIMEVCGDYDEQRGRQAMDEMIDLLTRGLQR